MPDDGARHKGWDSLPAPLTPADCDLRDRDWFPLYGRRLRASEWWLRASDVARSRSIDLWVAAMDAVPAGSLPDDDTILAQHAGFGRDLEGWRAIRDEVLAPWLRTSDGRLYHPTLSEVALDVWKRKQEENKRRIEDAERKRLAREAKKKTPKPPTPPKPPKRPPDTDRTSDGSPADVRSIQDMTSHDSNVAVADGGDGAPTSGAIWLQRLTEVRLRFGACLDASPNANTAKHLKNLCEPHAGVPCDWERDVWPAIETVLGGYVRRGETVSSLGVVCGEAIRNRDRRLAGLPDPEANPQPKTTRGSHGGRRNSGSKIGAIVRMANGCDERDRSDVGGDADESEGDRLRIADARK